MPKGTHDQLRRAGIAAFQADLRRALPFLGDRIDGVTGWDDVGYQEVRVNRLKRWS